MALASNSEWLESFYQAASKQAKQQNLPGFALVVVDKAGPTQIKTYGRAHKTGHKIDENTVFRLASVSKTFTAGLIARQDAARSLDWQTPLVSLLPDYKFDKYQKSPILLRHLIGQSTGYTPNAYDNLIEANYSLDRVLKHLVKLEPICKPGYCYTYQNTLFGALEKYYLNKGTSYAEQLTSHLIKPLKMPNASIGKQALIDSPEWAQPHVAIDRKKWAKVRVKDDYYRFSPAAGVNASASDMAIWLEAMLGMHPAVISEKMIKELTQPRVKTVNELRRRGWRQSMRSAHYGLGWRVYNFNGVTINYHGGWVQGYRADVAFAPSLGVGYAMLMNAESNLINHMTADFWREQIKQKRLLAKR